MKKQKRILVLLLVLAIAFSLVLAGCGEKTTTEDKQAQSSTGAAVGDTSAPASETKTQLSEVNLTWYVPGRWPLPDQQLVFDEFSKAVKEKINATVTIVPSTFADYDQKIKIVITAAEKYDLCFTAPWTNNYVQQVGKGAFLAMDDLFEKYASEAYNAVPKSMWEAAKVNGKIYGFINQQISARTPAFLVPKEIVDKYGIDMVSLTGKINVDALVTTVEPILQKVKVDYPNKYFVNGLEAEGYFFDQEWIAGFNIPGAINFNDEKATVFNQFESDAVKKWAGIMRDWNAKGYMNAKERITKKGDDWPDAKAGKFGLSIISTYKPGVETSFNSLTGYENCAVPCGTYYLTTGGTIATMTAINARSENPERAMMFINLMNTDKELYTLLNFGIKDKHYVIDADGFMVKEGKGSEAYTPDVAWMFATNFLATPLKGEPKDIWEQTRKINAEAVSSPIMGFNFNNEPVKSETGKCAAVVDEYRRAIELGAASEKDYEKFISKLKAAGSDKIVNEMQKQINEFLATR